MTENGDNFRKDRLPLVTMRSLLGIIQSLVIKTSAPYKAPSWTQSQVELKQKEEAHYSGAAKTL